MHGLVPPILLHPIPTGHGSDDRLTADRDALRTADSAAVA